MRVFVRTVKKVFILTLLFCLSLFGLVHFIFTKI